MDGYATPPRAAASRSRVARRGRRAARRCRRARGAARRAREAHSTDDAPQRSRRDRRREPRRSARDHRGRRQERLVHAGRRSTRGCRTCTSTCSSRRTRRIPNPDDFVARASELGAAFNGTTSEERVNYYLTVPADSVEGGMKFLAAALMHPAVPQGRARARARSRDRRIRSQRVEPVFRIHHTTMGKALWSLGLEPKESARRARGHSKHDAGEDADDPAALLRPEQHGDHHHRRHRAGPKAFALAHADVRRLASEAPIRSRPIRFRPIPPLTRDTGVIVEQPIGSVVVMLQWQGPGATAGSGGDLRGRRLFGRARISPARAFSGGSSTAGCFSRSA